MLTFASGVEVEVEPPLPPIVNLAPPSTTQVVVPVGGPSGAAGVPGPRGEAGLDGAGSYLADFGFAVPSTTWTITHNQESSALGVLLFDSSGEPIEGLVRFVSTNVIEVDWYYPTAGLARVYR